ncbi:MAG: methyl-accepting chemotaxis protein, partial [Planctomycetota bacterium]
MKYLLKRIKIGRTLWAAFGLLLCLSVGQGVAVVKMINSAASQSGEATADIAALSAELAGVKTDSEQTANDVQMLAQRVNVDLVENMKEGESEMQILLRNVSAAVSATDEVIEELENLLDSDGIDDDTAASIEDLLFSVEDSGDRIRKKALPLVRSGVERLASTAETSRQTADSISGLATTVSGFADASRSVTAKADKASDQIQRSSMLAAEAGKLAMFAAVIVIFLGIALPLTLVPRISAEVKRTIAALEGVAQGDLTQRLNPKSFDEFNRISTSLNAAVKAMEDAVGTIRNGSIRLASSSDNLGDKANSLSEGADQTTAMSVEVAESAEEMSSSMSEIANSVEEVSNSNTEIATAAEKMLDSISQVSNHVEKAVGVADEATQLVATGTEKIGSLGVSAGEIKDVSQVKQDISDMTNLLALKAT